MVGIFSRFSSRSGHRRAQSALDGRDVLPSASEATTTTGAIAAAAASSASAAPQAHGIALATAFKPVERPSEPLDNDQPIQCPLPEPSMINDGRLWKERISSGVQRRGEMPVMQEEQTSTEADTLPGRPRPPPPPNRVILPSISAPEHNLLNLLDECNA